MPVGKCTVVDRGSVKYDSTPELVRGWWQHKYLVAVIATWVHSDLFCFVCFGYRSVAIFWKHLAERQVKSLVVWKNLHIVEKVADLALRSSASILSCSPRWSCTPLWSWWLDCWTRIERFSSDPFQLWSRRQCGVDVFHLREVCFAEEAYKFASGRVKLRCLSIRDLRTW